MRSGAEGTLLELIGHAYDAGLGRRPWTVLLEALAEALGSRATHFLVHDELGHDGLVGAVRSDPEWRRRYLEHFASVNPYLSHPAAQHAAGVVHSGDWLTRAELERTEFYSDFLRKQDVFPVLVGNLFSDRRRQGFLASYRRFNGKAFGAEERKLLASLLPHVQRAIQVSGVLGQLELERSGWWASLDLLEHGIIVLDRSGAPLFVNRSAHHLLGPETGLVLTRNELRAVHPAEASALATLIASALRTASGDHLGTGGCVALRQASGGHALGLMVAPLPRRSAVGLSLEDTSRIPAVMVFLAGPGGRAAHDVPAALLGPLFDLTPREAEVARLLGRGLAIAEAASSLGIAFHTARVHQRRIYDKMGIHSQAELTRLFRTITPPFGVEPSSCGGSAPRSRTRGFPSGRGAEAKEYREYCEVRQRRLRKTAFWVRYDFHHRLLGVQHETLTLAGLLGPQDDVEHVCRGVRLLAVGQELREIREHVAAGDERRFVIARGAVLAEPNGGEEAVAQAHASHGVLRSTTLELVDPLYLRWTGVAEPPLGSHVRHAELAHVAGLRAGCEDGTIPECAGELDHLEREAARRGSGVGANLESSGAGLLDEARLEPGLEAGFLAERKRCAHLNADGSGRERLTQLRSGPVGASEPEGSVEQAKGLEIHFVAGPVGRLPLGVEVERPSRRRVVPARGGSLDDEAVGRLGRACQKRRRQIHRGHDGEHLGPHQRRQGVTEAVCVGAARRRSAARRRRRTCADRG